MKGIIEISELGKIEKNKKIVVVGGCFDILHLGHVTFLEKAKKKGEVLVVLLESDEKIKKIKGEKRPINNQENRARVLASLKTVDWVVKLPEMKNDKDYVDLLREIRPEAVAISGGDENKKRKQEETEKLGIKLIEVSKRIPFHSTSRIIEILENDNEQNRQNS